MVIAVVPCDEIEDIDEMPAMVANPLGGKHRLIAEAEFAITGHVPPGERELQVEIAEAPRVQ